MTERSPKRPEPRRRAAPPPRLRPIDGRNDEERRRLAARLGSDELLRRIETLLAKGGR